MYDYWSSKPAFRGHSICGFIMIRNRFEKLLTHIHLADNETADNSNRLYKIDIFIQYLNCRCQEIYRPEKELWIDELLIQIVFWQYVLDKSHRYGIKILKLNIHITCRFILVRSQQEPGTVAERTLFELSKNSLDNYRTLFTYNLYSSVQLAQKLFFANTNFVETLRKNCKETPKEIITIKLKRSEMAVTQNKFVILILKWKYKRDVVII